MMREKCVARISANESVCKKNIGNSTATATALIPKIGYENAAEIIKTAIASSISIQQAAINSGLITPEEFEELTSAEAVCRLGN
jgi:aspartate ammonia-lyase